MDSFDEAGPFSGTRRYHSLPMDFLGEAGPSSRPHSYDNCIYHDRSDLSNSEENASYSEPLPEIYADRTQKHESIFPDEKFVYQDSQEAEDEAYTDCEKPARLFESLVGFAANVEGYLKNVNCLTKEQVLAEIKSVRKLLIENADIFEQMMDFLLNKHQSQVQSVKQDESTTDDVSSGVFSDENTYDTKPIIADSKVLSEKSHNTENVNTRRTPSKYNLRAPKPKFSKYDSMDDKENSDPKQKTKRKSNANKSIKQEKKEKQIKTEKSNLKINPVAKKLVKQSKQKKKIDVKYKANKLKSDPEDVQNQLVVNLTDILKQLPKKVKKPAPIIKKEKPPTYKISETNVRASKRAKVRRTVYLAGERLFLNANGTLSRVDDAECDPGVIKNKPRNKRKSECLFKDDAEPIQRNKMNVNVKGSQSLPIVKKRKLYSPDDWMMTLNEKGIGNY